MNTKADSSIGGFSLVEVIVAIGLAALLSVGVATVTLGFLKNIHHSGLNFTRDQIVNQLRATIIDKRAILVSLKKAENQTFYNCVCGFGTCTNMQQPYPDFTLYDSSGKIQSPTYFDASGMPCKETTESCFVRVKMKYFAQCKPDFTSGSQDPTATCNGTPAEFITFFYTVDENPNSSKQKIVHFMPISSPVYLQISDLPPGACP